MSLLLPQTLHLSLIPNPQTQLFASLLHLRSLISLISVSDLLSLSLLSSFSSQFSLIQNSHTDFL